MGTPGRASVWLALPALLVGGAAHALAGGGSTPPRPEPRAALKPPPVRHARHARPPASFVLVAGGDVALAGAPTAATFAGIRPVLSSADLAVANLEGTLATGGGARCLAKAGSGCFTFRASPGWAGVLRRAGFDALNVANNHALDFGRIGQSETLAALRSARLAYDGLPGQITYVRAGKVRVALIGCAPYQWAQELLDVRSTTALVRTAARHAEVVVVYMHAGAEGAHADHVADREETYLGERRGNPVRFAHAMVDAGADLVFASGPHVLRGLQWYGGRLVAYSLGNLATSHTLATEGPLGVSALLRLRLDDRGRFVAGSLVSLRLDAGGTPRFDPRRDAVHLVTSLSRQDFGRAAVRLSPTGAIVRKPRACGATRCRA